MKPEEQIGYEFIPSDGNGAKSLSGEAGGSPPEAGCYL